MKVSGVKVFDDANPKKVNVLFGRIESDSMQRIANDIMEYFIAEGLTMIKFNFNILYQCGSWFAFNVQVYRSESVTEPVFKCT